MHNFANMSCCLFQPVTPLKVVPANSALRLRAVLDFEDADTGDKRTAGDEWLFEGPGEDVVVVCRVCNTIVASAASALAQCWPVDMQ